jgi:alpha-galactosidase
VGRPVSENRAGPQGGRTTLESKTAHQEQGEHMAKERVVGVSSGWKGPVEEYTKNRGSAGRKRIVFVGASYLFVHKVLRDMLLVGGFNDVELVVHDIDPEPMRIVGDLLEKIARQKKTRIRVLRTLDRKEALKGADAVILSITTGGREADFRSFEVCFKYGIPVGVGDTLGPPALARCLRELPEVVRIARDMEKMCPKAILLNFTNPMSCITGVVNRESSIPAWGLCHSADSLYQYFSEVFRVKKKDLRMEVGGVNHQAFVTRLWVKGKERTADILEASLGSHAKFKDALLTTSAEEVKLQQDVFRILKAWPSCGDTHLAEFYKYFFTERRLESLGLAGHMRRVIPGRERFGRKSCPDIIREWTYGPEPVGDLHLLTSEHAHELLWACFTGEPFTRILNVMNTDELLKGIPRNACVEAEVTVKGRRATGSPVLLTPAVNSLVHRWVTIHDLSIKAALNCDRDAARQALFLDPHVRDFYDIEPMLEDMLEATKEWLPETWFE